jgi:type III secretion system FlhB-like substrate exporter
VEVPRADVVVTNPTHFAVALRYDREADAAPVVVAKGADLMAKRIRELAKEHDVPVIENPLLARALYKAVGVSGVIPPDLFRAVAELLAYVYRQRDKAAKFSPEEVAGLPASRSERRLRSSPSMRNRPTTLLSTSDVEFEAAQFQPARLVAAQFL